MIFQSVHEVSKVELEKLKEITPNFEDDLNKRLIKEIIQTIPIGYLNSRWIVRTSRADPFNRDDYGKLFENSNPLLDDERDWWNSLRQRGIVRYHASVTVFDREQF